MHHQPSHPDLEAAASNLAALPSLSSIEAAKSDHLMSTLGFPSYITASAASTASTVTSRKFHEGNNGIMTSTSSYQTASEAGAAGGHPVTSSPAYPYFTSPGADLYTGTYASNTSSAVFSSKTLQPTRPRTKSRANAGKI